MIAIATGFDALDKKIEEVFRQNGLNDLQIVNYREFLLQQPFDTVIMSKALTGQVEFEFLTFSLRAKNVRIIFLTNENDVNELKVCLNYGIYDLMFDPIIPAQIFNIYQNPKTFADAKNIFVIVNGNDDKNKSKDIEKLMKMEEMQHVSLIQEDVVETPNQPIRQNVNQEANNQNNVPNIPKQDIKDLPKMNRELQFDMPTVENNVQSSGSYQPQQNIQNTPQVVQGGQNGNPQNMMSQNNFEQSNVMGMNITQNQNPNMSMPNMNEQTIMQTQSMPPREVTLLSESDFNSKRVIKETEIQSVYQVPHDYKKTIVLLSPESTGKTTVATNMAWYFNKKGIKTSLIDTDFKKKDIYYSFPIDTAECLSKVPVVEDVQSLGINAGKFLKVYTEHKDVDVNLELYDVAKLITSCKKNSQVVIIDLDFSLNQDIIRTVLEAADDIIIVVDQKVTTLNRIPEELYLYRNQLQKADLIVNRYYNIKYLEKERLREFFRNIDVYNGKSFDIMINKIFAISDDAKSVLQGLAERTPAIEIRDNLIEDDIQEICGNYFMLGKKK